MKAKPKKKAIGSAKSKNAAPAKKNTRPAKSVGNSKKSVATEIPIRNGVITITPEQIKEWDKTRGEVTEDLVWPPPTLYKDTDLIYRTPRLSSERQEKLDYFVNNIGKRNSSPNKCKTPDALSGELAELLKWYGDTKRKGDSWANSSETKRAIERWRNGAEELSEGLKDMLNFMKDYGMRESSCKYPKAIFVIERLGFVKASPFLDDLLAKINKLTLAFQFAEKKLKNNRGRVKEIFRINFAFKLAVIFEHNFTRPPTTGENGDFHQFLEMVFRWLHISGSYIHSDVLKALGFIKKQKLAEIE